MGAGPAQARRNARGRFLSQQNQQYQQSVPGFNTASPCAEDGNGLPYLIASNIQPAHIAIWEFLVCCRPIGFVLECPRVARPVPGGIVVVRSTAARGARSSRHYQNAEVVQPVSHETSSQVCVPRRPDLRWSGPFRLRHPRNSGLPDATREVVRPILLETSSNLLGSDMP